MIPKLKAKELVDKFRRSFGRTSIKEMQYEAKQCAKICVNEMLKEVGIDHLEYWQRVLKEIDKL